MSKSITFRGAAAMAAVKMMAHEPVFTDDERALRIASFIFGQLALDPPNTDVAVIVLKHLATHDLESTANLIARKR